MRSLLGTATTFGVALLASAAIATAANAGPELDPGHPYVDANCDRAYDPADGDVGRSNGVDLLALILAAEGSFDTSAEVGSYRPPPAPACFVWPRSVRLASRSPTALDLTAGVDLVFLGSVRLRNGTVTLAAGRRLEADGASLVAGGEIELSAGVDEDSSDGVLSAVAATLRSAGDLIDAVSLSATKAIDIRSIDVRTRAGVAIVNSNLTPGDIDAAEARISSKEGTISIESAFSWDPSSPPPVDDVSVRLNKAKLRAPGVDVRTDGASILAEGARIRGARIEGSQDSDIFLDSAGGLVALDRARLDQASSITVWTWVEPGNPTERSSILAGGARLRSLTGGIDFDAGCGGWHGLGGSEILAQGMSLLSDGDTTLTATSKVDHGFIDVRNAHLAVTSDGPDDPSPSDLFVGIFDDEPVVRESTIDARGARVQDPLLPTFLAENVPGDPTPNFPDLAFSSGLRLTHVAASQWQLDWGVENQGPREVPAGTRIRFFASADSSLDAGDVDLGAITLADGLPGRSGRASGATELTIADEGLFHVFAVVDPDDAIRELDEHNNVAAARRPLPDLVFAGVALEMLSDTEAQVDWEVRNTGDFEAAVGFAIDFYRSSDATLDAADTLLTTSTLAEPLAAGQSADGTEVFGDLPSDASFFLIVVVDPSDAVVEINELNNTRAIGLAPDLATGPVVAQYSASEQKFVITFQVRNLGVRDAIGLFETHFTLSSLASVPPVVEVLLASVTFNGLEAGGLRQETVEVPFEAPTGEGFGQVWWLVTETDAAKAIAETHESNNGAFTFGSWVP